jgi:host factor-I protein
MHMTDLKTAMRMADKSENIQDLFLNNARRDRALVTLLLMNGSKLTGKVRSFDKWSLVLDANHQDQLVYKHAIATITAHTRANHGGTAANGNSSSEG